MHQIGQRAHGVLIISGRREFPPDPLVAGSLDLCEGWLDTLSVAGCRLRHKGILCDAVLNRVAFLTK